MRKATDRIIRRVFVEVKRATQMFAYLPRMRYRIRDRSCAPPTPSGDVWMMNSAIGRVVSIVLPEATSLRGLQIECFGNLVEENFAA